MYTRLRDAISKLGTTAYVPGSSASGGWLYNPLPFPGCDKFPCHRKNSPERWNLISTNLKGKRVLDIGCATGYFSFKAALAGASIVVGIDHDPAAIEVCNVAATIFDVPNVQFEHMVVVTPPSQKYDVVFAMAILNWMGRERAEEWLDWIVVNESEAWIEMPLKGDGRRGAHWLTTDPEVEKWLKGFFPTVERVGKTYGAHCRRWRSLWKCR